MRRVTVVLALVLFSVASLRADDQALYRGQTTDQWLEQLHHPSPSARAAAAQAFVKIGAGNESSVEPLITLLKDRDERVRFFAAYALGGVNRKHDRSATALIEALPDSDEHVRYASQWSLVQIARQLVNSDEADRETLAATLTKIETELLVAGALPGHVRTVREAIAATKPKATSPTQVVETPVLERPVLGKPQPAPAPDAAVIDAIIQQLSSDDLNRRIKAIQALTNYGPTGVRRLLANPQAISEPSPTTWLLTQEIAKLGKPVVPILLDVLPSDDEGVGQFVADALADIEVSEDEAFPLIIDLLDGADVSNDVRHRALTVLISMGPAAAPATDVLVELVQNEDEDQWILERAVEALGAIGPGAASGLEHLIEALHNKERLHAQLQVVRALIRIDPKAKTIGVELVQAFHETESTSAAIAIARLLGEHDLVDDLTAPRLVALFDEAAYDQAADLIDLLGKHGSSHEEEVLALAMDRLLDPTEGMLIRVAAAKAIGDLGPSAVEELADVLVFGDESEQVIAARALVEIKEAAKPAQDALAEVLAEEASDAGLRALTAVAIGQIGVDASDAAPLLTQIAEDDEADGYLRSMAAVALSQVDSSAKPILESLLTDDDPQVQIAVAYALCKMDAAHAGGLAVLVHWLESDEHRELSIRSLVDIGEASLSSVVQKMNDATQTRDTRTACIEVISSFDDRANTHLLAALNDEALAEDAGWALRDRGNNLIPLLVASSEDSEKFSPEARTILSSVVEDMMSGLGAGGGDESWQEGHALVQRHAGGDSFEGDGSGGAAMQRKSATAAPYEPLAMEAAEPENYGVQEEVEAAEPEPVPAADAVATAPRPEPKPDGYIEVDVFYGTNREAIVAVSESSGGGGRLGWLVAIGAIVAVAIFFVVLFRRGAVTQAVTGMLGLILILFLGMIFWLPAKMREGIDKPGPKYGSEVSDKLSVGVCQVTIPDTHTEGEVETPGLLSYSIEDQKKHIVMTRTKSLGGDKFLVRLDQELQDEGNSILVFVHGYNVSFEDAARRTAQMKHDLDFAGAAAFFSWPSQADWWKYRVDEKHVELSVDPLKEFLLTLAEQSNADTINLVAHSMGNRALTGALKEIEVAATGRDQLFNQVILAAPDIDADIFKRRIAPSIVDKAKRITLYASSKDLALVASRTFNSGDPRAGDAGANLVVVPGIETIDVSKGDSSLLGHSYYGDNVSVLRDIEFLLRNEPTERRNYLLPTTHPSNLTYWMFQPDHVADRRVLSTGNR